jgi:hypothetical protein
MEEPFYDRLFIECCCQFQSESVHFVSTFWSMFVFKDTLCSETNKSVLLLVSMILECLNNGFTGTKYFDSYNTILINTHTLTSTCFM